MNLTTGLLFFLLAAVPPKPSVQSRVWLPNDTIRKGQVLLLNDVQEPLQIILTGPSLKQGFMRILKQYREHLPTFAVDNDQLEETFTELQLFAKESFSQRDGLSMIFENHDGWQLSFYHLRDLERNEESFSYLKKELISRLALNKEYFSASLQTIAKVIIGLDAAEIKTWLDGLQKS